VVAEPTVLPVGAVTNWKLTRPSRVRHALAAARLKTFDPDRACLSGVPDEAAVTNGQMQQRRAPRAQRRSALAPRARATRAAAKSDRRVRALTSALVLGVHAGCHSPLYLGSDLIWTADQETGDLSQWSEPNGAGGSYVEATGDASVAVTTEQAHTGQYSIKLSTVANSLTADPNDPGGCGVYREETFPTEAYYSVWYYVPQLYQTITSWAILKFRYRESTDAGSDLSELIDLRLESQPSGDFTLVLYDHRQQYLRSPLPDPPPTVPVGQWFQLEAFYRNVDDPTGRLTIWLDGSLVYDVARPMSRQPAVYFTPCSLVNDLAPPRASIYVDDVAVSWTRIGPAGIIEVPQ